MATLHEDIKNLLPTTIEVQELDTEKLLVTYVDKEKSRFVQIKLGRLLATTTDLSDKQIKELVEFQKIQLQDLLVMKLTQNAEEIIDCYRLRVSAQDSSRYSCMHESSSVRVYAYDKNLHLAMFYNSLDTSKENYVGRCLVRTDNMVYVRTYARSDKQHLSMVRTLEHHGFWQGNLEGIELAKEFDGFEGKYVMPYLDNLQNLEEYSSCFKIVDYPTAFLANSTDGFAKVAGCICANCGRISPIDETHYIEDAGDLCEDCINSNYTTFNCTFYALKDCHEVHGGSYDGQQVPLTLMSDYHYYYIESLEEYHHRENCIFSEFGTHHINECVRLEEEDSEGSNYAPEDECSQLTEEELGDCPYFTSGWYTHSRYQEILAEIQEWVEEQVEESPLQLIGETA